MKHRLESVQSICMDRYLKLNYHQYVFTYIIEKAYNTKSKITITSIKNQIPKVTESPKQYLVRLKSIVHNALPPFRLGKDIV